LAPEGHAPDVAPAAHPRPDWDAYFLTIARDVAARSTCPRRAVGAVLVRERRILTTGYNGAPRGAPHCTEVGCQLANGHCQRAVHAEMNAVVQAALHGVSTQGSTLYCTSQPCYSCAKVLVNAGVVRVVYQEPYDDPLARELFATVGVALEIHP
jgi:dCMP deaminase